MIVTQVELFVVVDDRTVTQVCFLPGKKSDFKVGMKLTLKDDDRVWTIGEVFSTQNHFEINRKWDVGGL